MYMLLLKHRELLRNCVQRVRADERGQTMIEYSLIAFLIAIAAIILLAAIGFDIGETFDKVEDALGLGTTTENSTTPGDNDANANGADPDTTN